MRELRPVYAEIEVGEGTAPHFDPFLNTFQEIHKDVVIDQLDFEGNIARFCIKMKDHAVYRKELRQRFKDLLDKTPALSIKRLRLKREKIA